MKIKFIILSFLIFLDVATNAQEKKSLLTLPVAIYSVKHTDFHSYNFGIGYEYRPITFFGFEISSFYGKFNHDYYDLDGFMDDIQNSYMLYDGHFTGVQLSNRGYLFFNDKKKLALYAEYYLGGYSMNSEAEGVYKEVEMTGVYESGLKFYHGIAVGAQLAVTRKWFISVSIGENSINFTESVKNTKFNNDPEISLPYTSLGKVVYQFKLYMAL